MTSTLLLETLPPGQRIRSDLPRFGLNAYAFRFPRQPQRTQLSLLGDGLPAIELPRPLAGLARVERSYDFHCVTTWTCRQQHWGGVRFADFYRLKVAPLLPSSAPITTVLLRGQDGYTTTLPLADLLADDVLLADHLNGAALPVAHGAPLRLVTPAHYGYKSVKHVARLEFRQTMPPLSRGLWSFLDHPRARVAHEERGRWLPGWLLRRAYRPLIESTVARFALQGTTLNGHQSFNDHQ
jgi:Oxidoreductase molybdopterin binding domain